MTREDLGIPANSIALVHKGTQRVVVYHIASLNYADCYQAENIRDFSTWDLAQADVPEKQASDWLRGNDLALDSIR